MLGSGSAQGTVDSRLENIRPIFTFTCAQDSLLEPFFLVDPLDFLMNRESDVEEASGAVDSTPGHNEPPCDAQDAAMLHLSIDMFSDASETQSPEDCIMDSTDSPGIPQPTMEWSWGDSKPVSMATVLSVQEASLQHSSTAIYSPQADSEPCFDQEEKRRLAEKKQRVRGSQKELLRQLDAFLPPLDAGEARQPRALTPSGRSLFQILEGASKLVRSYMSGVSSDTVREGEREHWEGSARAKGSTRDAASGMHARGGGRDGDRSDPVGPREERKGEELTGRLAMGRWMGRGMREYVEAAPWYGDLKEEVTLDLLVHPAEQERLGRYLKAATRSTNRVPCEMFRMCRYRAEEARGVKGHGETSRRSRGEKGGGKAARMQYEVVRWKAFRGEKKPGGRKQQQGAGAVVLLVGVRSSGAVCF
ncbi:hypothetical protein GUITHDRAFT_142103 [Guillardia theta CCMP2712]|uniref:Uncharacterized protein n=2 Tax=Guillardia theta TaxID=55529 RepID=L1IYV6_GUITC|nr:hypothetical protein GUITHDRAFT_142103 [Guillardia theta CCMP2712]EKX41421.1 hypothetical protein GUITHDRAFT_142103 [Guillardia theta CCMP2712]|eukprot:XP_005828401.1 hypothetical protein GUITHDRAFT_142103 [Guillardia theta CCMP2712]